MDSIRHWLMTIIAGRKFAWWISDAAQKRIDTLSVAGGGAAICLAEAVKKTGASNATYTLGDCKITVSFGEGKE